MQAKPTNRWFPLRTPRLISTFRSQPEKLVALWFPISDQAFGFIPFHLLLWNCPAASLGSRVPGPRSRQASDARAGGVRQGAAVQRGSPQTSSAAKGSAGPWLIFVGGWGRFWKEVRKSMGDTKREGAKRGRQEGWGIELELFAKKLMYGVRKTKNGGGTPKHSCRRQVVTFSG